MMKRYGIRWVCLVLAGVVLAGCGTDLEKGKAALEKKDLATAKASLEKALKKDPESMEVREALTQTYALRAIKFFNKNKKRGRLVIKKAEETFDPQMGQTTKDLMCDYFLMEAAAYLEDGKENKALEKLELANTTYGPNDKVTAEYNKVRVDYAQHMFKQGKSRYEEGVKKRDDFKLLYAESYLAYALKYDPTIKEAEKLLCKVRKKTLAMPNPDEKIPLAVTKVRRKAKETVLHVYAKANHPAVTVNLAPTSWVLVDKDGLEYKVNEKKLKKMFKAPKTTELAKGAEADFALVFDIDKKSGLKKLMYHDGSGNSVDKYFP